MDRLVIVDADTLVFSAAAVSETRSIEVLHNPTGITKSFSTRTEFKKLMKEKNKEITEDYVVTDKQEAEPVENCLHLVKSAANKIIDRFQFDEVLFFAGDSNNFRRNLPLPTRYKGNRTDMIKPLLLKEAHSYFKNKFKAISAENHEADDEVIIQANKGVKAGKEVVILSMDKDSRQAVGAYLGDYSSSFEESVYISDMHDVVMEDKKVRSYGVPWICLQLLIGDSADCYKPTELCSAKFGDVGAYKELKDCKTPQEALEKVKQKYMQWYPEDFEYTDWKGNKHQADWKSILQLYFKCVKMKTFTNDLLCVDTFFDYYGVKL